MSVVFSAKCREKLVEMSTENMYLCVKFNNDDIL